MTNLLRILVLEDDSSDAELIQGLLEADGFVCEITRVETRAEFLSGLENDKLDLILSDYKLPSFGGFSALKLALSARPDLPFIVVSGTLGEELAIESLKLGATDYVLKTRLSRLVPSVRRAVSEASERAERRKAEQSIREQSDLLNLTHDAIIVRDMNGIVTYWNRGAEALYGWTAEEAKGKVVAELLKTIFPLPFERRTGRWEGELVCTRKDGTEVAVASRWSVQRNDQGTAIAVLETTNDITDRKRAEQAREEIEEQWRAAFENNPTMYFIVDTAGAIVTVNPFGAEQLGYNVSELLGRPVLEVFYEPDRDAVQKHARECFEQPTRTMRWEARKVRKDGTRLWVRETANAVMLKKRPVLLVVCEDITERKRAQDAAIRSERELRNAIETMPAIAWSALSDGSNTFTNRRWAEYTGLSAEQTAGSGWHVAVHPDDVQQHISKWQTSLATGELFENEVRFRRADGEYRWHLARGLPLRDEEGQTVKWHGTLTDIEDRKRAEALLAGEKRILEMVSKGDSLSQILDALCRLVEEHTPDVLASVLLIQNGCLKHGGAPSLPKAYVEAIDGVAIGPAVGSCGTAAYLGKQVIVSDIANDPLWVDFRDAALSHSLRACWSTPIVSSERKVIGTFAMYYRRPQSPDLLNQEIIDQITHLAGVAIERKLTNEQLQRSEAYLADALRLSHTGSWAYKPDRKEVFYWSEEMFRIFGFDPLEGMPSYEAVSGRIHPEDREKREKAIHEKVDYVTEYKTLLPDQTVKHIQTIGHPVIGMDGEIVEYIGVSMDITERKRAEGERERLRQLEADLAHMNRVSMMGELAASVSHEVKQPISAVAMNARACLQWLEGDPLEIEEIREAVSAIVDDVTRAATVVDRNLSLYKRGAPQRALIDLNEVIREIVFMLRDTANRHSILIQTELPALPKTAGDRVQLQQVLMNLMLNGIEAMKGDRGELHVVSSRSGDGELLVSVRDSGVGLPVDGSERVFDAFFTTKPQGTGMGLSISRRIVESHGGRLWARANTGRGATFYFTLPTEVVSSSPSAA